MYTLKVVSTCMPSKLAIWLEITDAPCIANSTNVVVQDNLKIRAIL